MATEKKTFLFNAKNGVMTANLTETLKNAPDIMNNLDLTKFKVKEVEFDNTTHYWDGDHDSGSVKPMHDKTIIREAEVIHSANIRVLEAFPLHKQLNIIIEMLDQSDIPNTEKFTKLKDHVKAIKEETKEQKKVYAEDPAFEYVSMDEEIAKANKVTDL
ncbi:hypothetical protein CMI38_06150 [Candidatus Pacearchaeota archaeon]|jgi:hypothetical protein|nr:hypothetical protein [Candidatus Pacearchaeota archaeon]|tara:strand:+ start:123 stop:599 length:477 start_codon:yes stop_codon:yes gene_type:complete